MNLDSLEKILQIVASIISIIGFPAAIYVFYDSKRKEQRDREYGTYNALDEKYIEYLELCLQYPDLDVFDVPLDSRKKPNAEDRRKELMIFSILVSILERAYLMYKDKSKAVRREQYEGWERYMRQWSSRENFQRAWREGGFDPDTYDEGFYKHMNALVEQYSKPTPALSRRP